MRSMALYTRFPPRSLPVRPKFRDTRHLQRHQDVSIFLLALIDKRGGVLQFRDFAQESIAEDRSPRLELQLTHA